MNNKQKSQVQQPTVANAAEAAAAYPQGINVIVNQSTGQSVAQHGALERNHLVAILLAIFVGWLGIDRFYLGNPGIGLLKLFTFGLGGILWIVDIIMIATKSVKGIVWVEKK